MRAPSGRWHAATAGLFLSLFGVLALSGPGRIDIVDGQTRYEAARSLATQGDLAIRNDQVWFSVYPGRNGERHTDYRLPQILLGALAVMGADATGSVSEGRRHFFFVLTSALAAAALGPMYAMWFRDHGASSATALVLGALGVLCNASWFYGTSTFDDILGASTLVGTMVLGFRTRERSASSAIMIGLLVGALVHCKPPLGAFAVLGLAATYRPGAGRHDLVRRALWMSAGIGIMLGIYVAIDVFRFPPDVRATHAAYKAIYAPVWPGHPVTATMALLFSLGASVFLYNPPVVLGLRGIAGWMARERFVILGLALGVLGFGGFIVSMSIFKGDPAWGPRYFTPVFAALWLFVSTGRTRLYARTTAAVLAAGCLVQVLALAIDPHRLLVQLQIPNGWSTVAPQYLFHPGVSHLVQRPREIVEVVSGAKTATAYSPAWMPTAALPLAEHLRADAVAKYHVFASLRPWWIAQRHLEATQRPVPIASTVAVCLILTIGGLAMMMLSLPREPSACRCAA